MIAEVSPLSAELRARPLPVTIGLAGAGQMGTDIVVQVAAMPGLRIGAMAELDFEAARAAALLAGRRADDIVAAESSAAIDRAIEMNKLAVTQDVRVLCAAGRIEVVIDATGNPNTGAELALAAIANGKHVVMLNVEADITIGRHLKAEAEAAGVVYSGAAGDEPAATLELIGFAQSLGLGVVCAGKGKNNPLRFDAVPADYEAEARRRNMNPRMLVEFIDGSKTMIEMATIANCTGLVPDRPGMHGPAAQREDLASVLVPSTHGGVLAKRGCVDYSIGKGVAPGVFCIVEAEHPRLRERLIDLKLGAGPFFTLYRPYHLTSLEVPLTAARAVLHGRADLAPLDRPVAEAVAVAKRDLAAGARLGRIGEADYRAWTMAWTEARAANALPVGLAENSQMTAPVTAGQCLTYANCRPDAALLVTQLRRRLDRADADRLAAAAGALARDRAKRQGEGFQPESP